MRSAQPKPPARPTSAPPPPPALAAEAPVADLVELTDLDVIASYSVAVRVGSVERAELIDVLTADLDWLRATAADGR